MKLSKLTLLLPALLCACTMTPEECDPSGDPGMLDKLGCVVSGSYSKRVENKKAEIASLREEQKLLNKRIEELSAKRDEIINNRFARLKVLDKLDADIIDLKQRIRQKDAMTKELQAKIDKLEKSKSSLAALDDDAAPMEVKQKYKDLQDDMAEVVDVLTDDY